VATESSVHNQLLGLIIQGTVANTIRLHNVGCEFTLNRGTTSVDALQSPIVVRRNALTLG
jgi:hypothetical protein